LLPNCFKNKALFIKNAAFKQEKTKTKTKKPTAKPA